MWNDALSTGLSEINEQHRQLIAIGNRLNQVIRTGQGRQLVGNVLDELIDHTAGHFQFEDA